ncbi:DGQHR domain-containing protein [Aureivirga sp. CE67]|uniref:DGQHR domain-containing protein n=1 Tax=Aureivirga sp. CE67 TaxID=1788983 RepID=UPI0018C9FFA9|nr:DGQHR domain-containing protein [Aureivirga sp. CE67]
MKKEIINQLLQQLISDKDLEKNLRLRKKTFINKSILNKNIDEYNNLIKDGWELDKKFKNSKRLKKEKEKVVLFKDKVWCLFASLGFQTMNIDSEFKLNYSKNDENLSKKIDVFAKDDETILLIICKSSIEKNKESSFENELNEIKNIIGGLRTTINHLYPNQKLKFKFILATEDYSISENDKKLLNNINGIHFDDEIIKYYSDMQKQIGYSSRYQLLGSLFSGQEIPEINNQIPAIKGKMGGKTYFSFSIEPEKLLKIGYVLHRNKANINMMPTYQRIIQRSRLKSVHEFIDKKKGYFPNSIIISINSEKDLKFDRANTQVKNSISDVGILHLPKKYRSAFIIDGQHRLYGYANSEYKSKNSIPVVAFVNLEREEQVKLFMQINENQKAVSKNLRTTLNADLLWTSENYLEQHKALRSRISITLGENRNSALFDKISIGEDRRTITQEAFDKSLNQSNFLGKVTKNKVESLGTIYDGNLDNTFDHLSSFLRLTFNYIKDSIPEVWNSDNCIILINKGIYAFIKLQDDIINMLIDNKSLSKENCSNTYFEKTKTYLDTAINFIKNIDEETSESLRKAYGTGGYLKYWRTLQIAVRDSHEEFTPDGLDDYIKKEAKEFNSKSFTLIGDIELSFKRNFKEILQEEFGENWFKKGVPHQTAKKANDLAFEKNQKIENIEDEVDNWDCLTLIAYRSIALNNWKIFEYKYADPKEKKNASKNNKTKWMVKLEEIRNQISHQYSVTEEDYYFLEELHDRLGLTQ